MVHNAPRMKRKRFNNKGFQGDSIMFLQIKTFPFHATAPTVFLQKTTQLNIFQLEALAILTRHCKNSRFNVVTELEHTRC